MRFLHTADWQLGMKAVHVGAVARRVREERLAAAQRMVAAAREHHADFLLIAGDLFEDNAVDSILVRKTADLLDAFDGPVFVLPGNHDPLVPGCVWDRPVWRETKHVRILREAVPVEIPGGTLFPCPARERHGGADPTSWIQGDGATTGAGIRIGVAHGTVEGIQTSEPEYPIPRAAAERARLDYLALGHWHSTALYPDASGATRMAYAGTPEPSRFGERDSGSALLIEVASPGAVPRVTALRTGGLAWQQIARDVRGRDDLDAVRGEVEAIVEPGRTLIDVRLAGVLDGDTRAVVQAIEDILAARFLFHRIDVSALRPLPSDTRWLARLPAGVLREAAAHLQRLSDPSCTEPRPDGASPEVAARAWVELYALAAGDEMPPATESAR